MSLAIGGSRPGSAPVALALAFLMVAGVIGLQKVVEQALFEARIEVRPLLSRQQVRDIPLFVRQRIGSPNDQRTSTSGPPRSLPSVMSPVTPQVQEIPAEITAAPLHVAPAPKPGDAKPTKGAKRAKAGEKGVIASSLDRRDHDVRGYEQGKEHKRSREQSLGASEGKPARP